MKLFYAGEEEVPFLIRILDLLTKLQLSILQKHMNIV